MFIIVQVVITSSTNFTCQAQVKYPLDLKKNVGAMHFIYYINSLTIKDVDPS